MAHFQRPERGHFGEYDVDSKLAVGSVWRMRVPLGNASGVEVAIYGADGLTVRSNNPDVVSLSTSERQEGGCRVLRLVGRVSGTSMIEAGVWDAGASRWAPGSPWVSLQAQATILSGTTNGDNLIYLQSPHMALNASGSSVTYSMKYSSTIAPGTLPRDVIGKVAHTLKHLVFSSHGRIKHDNGQILDSEIEIGSGLWRADTLLFSQLKSHMAGGVIWLGGCALGNDNEGNIERARTSGCYVVAPIMYMINERRGVIHRPKGAVDMFERYGPKVFTPNGSTTSWVGFLGLKHTLGFSW